MNSAMKMTMIKSVGERMGMAILSAEGHLMMSWKTPQITTRAVVAALARVRILI
jgi:hypothetical protein